MEHSQFESQFQTLTGFLPMPWQTRLFECHFMHGRIPSVVDIPTGLGKTSTIALWLIAYLNNPDVLPRRLIYVVNRRTVVDQTTTEAERLRSRLHLLGLGLNAEDLALSTLRGQFADNQAWREDPSRPAIICGTVDMIGSRLLFGGYRIGFKSRPLHAGFLGQDSLLIHDEAHLEPAFQKLVEAIRHEQIKEQESVGKLPWPRMQLMALSATSRRHPEADSSQQHVGLTDEEKNPGQRVPGEATLPIHHVWQRYGANKFLALHACRDEKKDLPQQIAALAAEHKDSGTCVLIYVRRLDDVATVVKKLAHKRAHAIPEDNIATLTGTLRGYERDTLVAESRVFARFLVSDRDSAGDISQLDTVYLVCTSAGEVGINLSADHMVCDLATYDSMAQRLGRVNRFGKRQDTRIDVVHPTAFGSKDKKTALEERRARTLSLLQPLDTDASPKALASLPSEMCREAFVPEPTILVATDILFDAWAMTSIRGPMPGRPPLAPYLHGITDWEPPRTTVAWRTEVDLVTDDLLARHGNSLARKLLTEYPLKAHELLSDTSGRILKTFQKLADDHPGAPVWLVDDQQQITVSTIGDLAGLTTHGTVETKELVQTLADSTVVLPPSIGGLAKGLFDAASDTANDVSDNWLDERGQNRRQRLLSNQPRLAREDEPEGMALIRTIDTKPDTEETDLAAEPAADPRPANPRPLRYWHWYTRPRDAEEATLASIRPIRLHHHLADVRQRAEQIASRLGLPHKLVEAIAFAAECHDLGKRREIWQRSIGNPNPSDWYAKPGKPIHGPRWRPRHLSQYRHELGSVLDLLHHDDAYSARFKQLEEDMRDIVLHLIASHHGRARPHFLPEAWDYERHDTRQNEHTTLETMRRYARLQRHYGRWGLAYLESLVRAADWAASAHPGDHGDET